MISGNVALHRKAKQCVTEEYDSVQCISVVPPLLLFQRVKQWKQL